MIKSLQCPSLGIVHWNNKLPPETYWNEQSPEHQPQHVLEKKWDSGNSHSLLVGKTNGIAIWKMVWHFFPQLNIFIPCELAVTLVGYLPKQIGNLGPHKHCTRMFVAALLIITKT